MKIIQEKTITEQYTSLYQGNKDEINRESSPLLNRMRDVAIKRFSQVGVPDLKNEEYKYTNLKQAFSKPYKSSFTYIKQEVDLHEVFKCDVPQLDTHLILLINGWYYQKNSRIGNLPEGVVVGSLMQIANEKPELVGNFINRQSGLSEDPLVALNTAFAKDGLFLYISKGVVVEKPIQVVNLLMSDDNLFVTQRNLVVAEENSQVKLVFCDHTLSASNFLYNTVTEVFAGEHSLVDFHTIQNQHNKSVSLNSMFFKQKNNSNVKSLVATLHGGLVRNNLKMTFDGEHSEASSYGLAFTDKKQHVDNSTSIEHASANCLSDQIYKYILDDASTGAFAGRIHVARDAQQTNAFQRNNNVLLTSDARMQTKPQLIIDADDVKCSHGATIGQIDEEALFFLRSRGIRERDARLMLMNAFAYEVLQKINIIPLKERIGELVEKRLRGELSHCHDCEYKCDC